MYLYGASGHAKVIIDILTANHIHIDALVDDNLELTELHGIPVIHSLKDFLPSLSASATIKHDGLLPNDSGDLSVRLSIPLRLFQNRPESERVRSLCKVPLYNQIPESANIVLSIRPRQSTMSVLSKISYTFHLTPLCAGIYMSEKVHKSVPGRSLFRV